jgi:hypothetical protein
MICPDRETKASADAILSISNVCAAGKVCNNFLLDYIHDVEEFERREEENAFSRHDKHVYYGLFLALLRLCLSLPLYYFWRGRQLNKLLAHRRLICASESSRDPLVTFCLVAITKPLSVYAGTVNAWQKINTTE